MDYQCKPLKNGRSYKVTVPGSKSITNRALLLGALAEGKTLVRGVLFSEDSRVFMKALEEIGFSVKIDEEKKRSRDRRTWRTCAGRPGEKCVCWKRRDGSPLFDGDARTFRGAFSGGVL